MTPLQALALGIVQGLTEFLPISSSGHLVLVPWLFGWPEPGLAFDTTVHLGTLAAVLIFFREDLVGIGGAWLSDALALRPPSSASSRLGWLLILGTAPAVLMGLALEDFFVGLFSSPVWVAVFLLVTGGVLAVGEAWGRRTKTCADLNWKASLLIGFAQGCAIAPGLSRSGATISTGLLASLERDSAARYSFLLSVPIILGTSLLQLAEWARSPDVAGQAATMAAGFIAAAVSGYLAIRLFLGYVKRRPSFPFAIYCWLVGALLLAIALVRG